MKCENPEISTFHERLAISNEFKKKRSLVSLKLEQHFVMRTFFRFLLPNKVLCSLFNAALQLLYFNAC